MHLPLILASSSPRRQELLRSAGIPFELCACEVSELESGEPAQVVQALAHRKAEAAAALHKERLILAADTLVYAGGETLGKPRDAADALRMIRLLSGSEHEVFTGVCLLDSGSDFALVETDVTLVRFDRLSPEEMQRYVASGEPFGKAGGYAIQGRAGAFVSRIEGSYSNVVGLPLHLVRQMLQHMARINQE